MGLAAVDGKIYAIGGYDDDFPLKSVEAYDPQLGTWALVASMSEERKRHATVVLDGKIYVMGVVLAAHSTRWRSTQPSGQQLAAGG